MLFVGTANEEAATKLVLCDRLHMIRLDGYDEYEKLQITNAPKVRSAPTTCTSATTSSRR